MCYLDLNMKEKMIIVKVLRARTGKNEERMKGIK